MGEEIVFSSMSSWKSYLPFLLRVSGMIKMCLSVRVRASFNSIEHIYLIVYMAEDFIKAMIRDFAINKQTISNLVSCVEKTKKGLD